MFYAATHQVTDARSIVRSAQQQIKDRTGMNVSLMLTPDDATLKTPERMLNVIELALGMTPKSYKEKTRQRQYAELRFIAALILRQNFLRLTLQQIGALFGGYDHTSIINGLTRAHDLIYSGDTRFLQKYNTALKAVNLWMRIEEPGYELC